MPALPKMYITGESCLKAHGCVSNVIMEIGPLLQVRSAEFSQHCKAYAQSTVRELYPSGISPLQALFRTVAFDCLWARNGPFSPDSIDSQCSLISALRFIAPEAIDSGLSDRKKFASGVQMLGLSVSEHHVTDFLKCLLPDVVIDPCWNSTEISSNTLRSWEMRNLRHSSLLLGRYRSSTR